MTECVRQTSPRLLASLSPTWASSSPLPLPPAAPRVGCRRRRDSDAGGRWASDSVIGTERCQPQLVFFFNFSLLDSPPTCTSASRPCHAFVASFLPPSFLPVSSSFFSVASPFRLSAAGRPAFLLQRNQDYLLDLSKRGNQDSESKKQGDLC